MKRRILMYSGAFLLSATLAFAGKYKPFSATSQSYKLSTSPTTCHAMTQTVASCGGNAATCTIVDQITHVGTTFFSDASCGTVLKFN